MSLKEKTYQTLLAAIERSITTARSAMLAAQDSRDNETKSSAGDKFETGRAMMQIESEKNKVQLLKAIKLKKELTQINIQPAKTIIKVGSLVTTKTGIYFLAIGIGKVKVEEQNVFCISMASPIGQVLNGLAVGDSSSFQGRAIEVLAIQ